MFTATVNGTDGLDFVKPTFNQMTLRLICCYLFHFGNYKDVADSFRRMKFLRRFPERFDNKYVMAAWLLCFYQFTTAITVEFVNIIYLTRQENLV